MLGAGGGRRLSCVDLERRVGCSGTREAARGGHGAARLVAGGAGARPTAALRSRDADLARLALQTADQRVYLVVVRVAGDRDTVLLAIPAEAGDDARRYIPIVGDDAPPEPASLDERPPPAAG